MFDFYRSADGTLFTSPGGVAPQDVEWLDVYQMDDGADESRSVSKAAPVFPDAKAAVDWIRTRLKSSREEPLYQRRTMPDFATGGLDDPSFLGLGAVNNFGQFLSNDGRPAVVFRGQVDIHLPLLPTLARPLWSASTAPEPIWRAAIAANEREQADTKHFVDRFPQEVARIPGLESLADLSVQRWAAIARHHGFYSWIIDYTVDPGIAAFFATGAGSGVSSPEALGAIHIVDETAIRRLLGAAPRIVNHVGFQQRIWADIDVDTILRNATINFGGGRLANRVSPRLWNELRRLERTPPKLCVQLSLAPGEEAVRMWSQRWCGVEALCEDTTWRRVIPCYQLLGMLSSVVLFRQNGHPFEDAGRGITNTSLLPRADVLTDSIEAFKSRHQISVGRSTDAFLEQHFKPPRR